MMSQEGRNPPRLTQDGNEISAGATLKEKFRQIAQFLTPCAAPAPQPTQRRRRTEEETRGGFKLAARQIMHRAARLPAAAYAAVAFLSDTLDWLNPWHNETASADELHDDFNATEPQHIYPHP